MNLLNKVERDSVLKNNAEVRGPRSEVQGGESECECEAESQFESESAQERTQTHIHIHTSYFFVHQTSNVEGDSGLKTSS